jgi:hypothetical protein
MDLDKGFPDELSRSTRLVALLNMELLAVLSLHAVVVPANLMAFRLPGSTKKVRDMG